MGDESPPFETADRGSDNQSNTLRTRRRTLQLVAGAGAAAVSLPGLSAARTTQEDPTSNGSVVDIPGRSPTDPGPEVGDRVTVGQENEVEVEVGDVRRLPASGSGAIRLESQHKLEIPITINAFGVEWGLTIEHWAGTCHYEVTFSAAGQSFTSGRQEDCTAEYSFGLSIGFANANIIINPEPVAPGVHSISDFDIGGEICGYDPWNGWGCRDIDFSVDVTLT